METKSFAQKQQQAHELRGAERLQEDLRLARITIADYQLRENTLKDEIKRIDSAAADRIRIIKEEAVTKAAEVVEKVLAEDFATLCKQLGIEPQGAPEMPTSLRIAETMKWLGEDKARLDWLDGKKSFRPATCDRDTNAYWITGVEAGEQKYREAEAVPFRDSIDVARKA